MKLKEVRKLKKSWQKKKKRKGLKKKKSYALCKTKNGTKQRRTAHVKYLRNKFSKQQKRKKVAQDVGRSK